MFETSINEICHTKDNNKATRIKTNKIQTLIIDFKVFTIYKYKNTPNLHNFYYSFCKVFKPNSCMKENKNIYLKAKLEEPYLLNN